MQKIAVFPGSFDPITIGHVDLVKRALPLFDKIIIAIGVNSKKITLFDLEQRKRWISTVFADEAKVEVDHFEGLTVDFCKAKGARFLVRGLRSAADFDYEKTISQINHIIGNNIETVFLISKPGYSHISSSVVREVIAAKGDVSAFIPESIKIK
jgi:pantetheine-phosphate adenylyltransferase